MMNAEDCLVTFVICTAFCLACEAMGWHVKPPRWEQHLIRAGFASVVAFVAIRYFYL